VRGRRSSRGLVTAFAICLLLAGCDQRVGDTVADPPGAPFDGGGDTGEGAPSPGRIPKISQEGLPLDSEPYVRRMIEDAFREECGNGEVCVNLVDRPSTDSDDADATVCEFLRIEGEGERFEPEDEIVIVTGPQPCDQPDEPEPEPEPETTS